MVGWGGPGYPRNPQALPPPTVQLGYGPVQCRRQAGVSCGGWRSGEDGWPACPR